MTHRTNAALLEVERIARETLRFRQNGDGDLVSTYLDGGVVSLDEHIRCLRLALVALDLARVADVETAERWMAGEHV